LRKFYGDTIIGHDKIKQEEMELTSEQLAIIQSNGDIKINAVAGSGKTTTVIEYARTRPQSSKILYLAFNKSVKLEASQKFSAKGMRNVKVETAHSLAYKNIVYKYGYIVKSTGYQTSEIVELLGIKGTGEKHMEYVIANHVSKFIAYFCNSDKTKVQELNYSETINDPKAKAFVIKYYPYIEKQTRILLSKMDKGEIEITHDFYLKKFQLSQPILPFDYILFDEGQDASAAMLDVFLMQKAAKVIVGDTHQQIYSWRFAVNSLEKAKFQTYHLSNSFRFGPSVAKLALDVLNWKKILNIKCEAILEGKGGKGKPKTKAYIARTNLGLLVKAIDVVVDGRMAKKIYFEGNFNSYTYADDGASLYDVLNLYNGKRDRIRDKLIALMPSMTDLEEYVEKTEDVQLGMMVELVKEYGNELPKIIKTIKEKHLENEDRDKAEIIFSTVHRSKGMEYDEVVLVKDFMTKEKLETRIKENGDKEVDIAKLNEEINLLYVAITRTKWKLHIPEELIDIEFPECDEINVIPLVEKTVSYQNGKNTKSQEKAYNVLELRKKHGAAYRPWTEDQDDELIEMYEEGYSINELAEHFERTKGAIFARIKKLELDPY
jgi:F-box protein 18 (helicase)